MEQRPAWVQRRAEEACSRPKVPEAAGAGRMCEEELSQVEGGQGKVVERAEGVRGYQGDGLEVGSSSEVEREWFRLAGKVGRVDGREQAEQVDVSGTSQRGEAWRRRPACCSRAEEERRQFLSPSLIGCWLHVTDAPE